MRSFVAVGVFVLSALPCLAQADVPDMFPKDPIGDLATILASEQMCGLRLSIDAIKAYVDKNLPEDGGMAVQRITGATTAAEMVLGHPEGALLAAHCAAVVKIADHLGLSEAPADASGD